MKKGITPIIAIIVLLLITVALAGAAWTYLSGYMQGLTGRSYDIRDSFCVGGTTGVILIANTGTNPLAISDIQIVNMSSDTGEVVTSAGTWTEADGAAVTSDYRIPVNGMAKWSDDGNCVPSCSYRVTGGTARALTANINC